MFDATVFSLFSPRATAQAFGFAIDMGLKSLVLAAAALLLDRAMCRRVLARSAVLHACLLGLALLPAAALVFPQLKLNLVAEQAPAELSSYAPRMEAVSRGGTGPNAELRRGEVSPAERSTLAEAPVPAREASPFAPRKDAVSRSESQQNADARPAAAPMLRPLDWRCLVVLIYATVALAALFRLSRSLLAVARLKRSGAPLAEPAWNEPLADWRARLGVARPVELLSSDRVDVPVVVGWRRPAILTPERLASADTKTIDAILLHELAHVRRADYAWNLLLRLVQAFYWPNPLLWLVGRSVARVREQACDEVCIHWLGGAAGYRATLVELAGSLLRRPLAALGMAMAGSSRLQRRLEQLGENRGRAECQSSWRWRFAALAVVASLAGGLGALKVSSRAAAAPPENVPADVEKQEARSDEVKAQQPQKANRTDAPKQDAGEAAADKPAEPIKVRVEKVRREDFVVQTSQPGSLKSSRTVELYSKIAGYIIARNVNTGDRVKAGQALAEIDAPELDAELEHAKGLAEEAPAAVEQARGKFDAASAGLEAAQAYLAKSEADALPAMRNQSVAVDRAQVAACKAEVKQAEAAVAVAKAGLQIAQLRLTAAQQALKRVEQRAAYRQIVAPADGVVMRQAAEPGSFAKLGGEPLFVISATSVVTMQTQIPERDALRIAPGQHARVWLDAEPDGKPHDAKVSRVGYVIDPKTRTMLVEIDLPNSDGRLRPGMYGGAAIDLETHEDVLTMPSNFESLNGELCLVVVDGRVVGTAFASSGRYFGGRTEVKSGLSEGDLIIVGVELPEGTQRISWQDGSRVEIVDSPAEDRSGAK